MKGRNTKMKKIAVIFLLMSIMTSLAACGGDKTTDIEVPKQTAQIGNSDNAGKPDEKADDSDLLGDINTDINEENDKNDQKLNHTETAEPSYDTTPGGTVNPEHEHSYSSEVTKEATCGDEGVKVFTCACGDKYSENINPPAAEHSWSEWETIRKPNTEEYGIEERKCSNCSKVREVYIPPIRYYDLSRFKDSDTTIDEIISVTTEFSKNSDNIVSKTSYDDDVRPVYDEIKERMCYIDTDFFGYDFTEYEVSDLIWGRLAIGAHYVDDEIKISGISVFQDIPMKTQDDVYKAAKRDIEKFVSVLTGNHDIVETIYVCVSDRDGNVYQEGLEYLTDDDIKRAADGTGNCEIVITSVDRIFTDKYGRKYKLKLDVKSDRTKYFSHLYIIYNDL